MPHAELAVFLNYLLPWDADHAHLYRCVTTFWTTKDGTRSRWPINEAVKNYDELVELIEDRARWRSADVFLAMGTQRMADTRQSRDGRAVIAIRKAENMATFNALWLDVDVGPDKPYKTTDEAREAAQKFYDTVGLPPPSLRVYSGSGGFHDYRCFAEPVEKDRWHVMAEALKRACQHHEFKVDDAPTADAARILRIPTTYNHKTNPPNLCRLDIKIAKAGRPYDPDELTPALRPFLGASKKAAAGGATATVSGIAANFVAGTEQKRPPVPIDRVAVNCPAIRDTLGTGGAGKSEPEWQLDIYLAAFTTDPEDAAQRLSQGHAEYDPQKTTEKLAQKQAAIAASNGSLGWPECARFKHAACKTCPLRDLGKSPLHFAQPEVPPIHPTSADEEIMPFGWFRNEQNWVLSHEAKGPMTIVPYAILDGFIDSESNELVIKYLAGKKERYGTISMAKQSNAAIAEAWTKGTNNLMVIKNQVKLKDFTMSFIQRLQSLGEKRTIRPTGMGWDGDKFIFDEVYTPHGSEAAYRSKDLIDLNYRREGSDQPWRTAMEQLIYGNTVMEILVASAFAAPLVSLRAPNSLILSVFSPASAFGKTTAISIAQAVWAQPEKMSQIQDTLNSAMGKLAALRHLPLYWDELKLQAEMEEIVKLVFRVIAGKDKARMKQDATLRKQAAVARTMMTICSNHSVMAMTIESTVGSDSGGVRVFELQADPLIKKPGVHAESLMLPLDNNYGVIGAEYAKFLVRNKKKVEEILAKVSQGWEARCGFATNERFWRDTMVTLTVGAMLANAAKLTRFDIDAIQQRLYATLLALRGTKEGAQLHATIDTHSAVGLFNEMFNELDGRQNLVITQQIMVGRGRPIKQSPTAKQNLRAGIGRPDRLNYKEIIAQQGREDGRRLIKTRYFHWWMREHHREPMSVLRLLEGEYKILPRRATLCAGLEGFELGQVDCYDFTPLNRNPSDPSASSG